MKKVSILMLIFVLLAFFNLNSVGCTKIGQPEAVKEEMTGAEEKKVAEEARVETVQPEETQAKEKPENALTPEQLEARGAENVKGKNFTIGIFQAAFPPWDIYQAAGALRANELNKKYGVNIKLDVQAPADFTDLTKHTNIIDDFVAKKVDMMIVIPVSRGSFDNVFRKANENNIPLGVFITMQAPPEGAYAEWWLYVEDIEGGRSMSRQMAEALKKKNGDYVGNVTICYGVYENSWEQAIVQGMREGLSEYPGIVLVDQQSGEWVRDKAMLRAEEWIARYGKDLDGVLTTNDEMGIGVYSALTAAGIEKDVFVTGWDGTDEGNRYVSEGKFLAGCDLHWMALGMQVIDLAFEVIKGNKIEPIRNSIIPTVIDSKDYADLLNKEVTTVLAGQKPDTWEKFKLFNYKQNVLGIYDE